MTQKTEDKRRHRRYYFKALVRLADSGEYSNVELESINISAGGIFFRSTQDFEMGQKLNLLFSLPDFDKPIEADCNVVHNLETIPGKQYFIGVKFSRLAGIDAAHLADYLEEKFE